MADITFYKYLEAAFRFRLLNPEGKKATLKTHFNYLGYNLPFERIFHYARKVLPPLYTLQFPNTEEGNLKMAKKVLDALDRKLDTQLEKYFDPTKTPVEYQQLIDEAQSESQQTEASGQITGGEAAETMGMPGLPSASFTRAAPRITRIIQNIPQTPEPPKPEIVVANSSGIVREAGDPSKLVATNSSGVIKEAGDPSKLVTTSSGGAVREAGDPSKLVKATRSREIAEPGQPSKLVTTGSSGTIKETPPSKIYIPQNRSGVPVGERPIPSSSASGRFNFRNFKLPGTLVNTMKNFGSAAGRFFQRNMGKFFTVGRIGMAVSAGIGAVAGAGFGPIGSLAGAAGGGIGSFWIKSGDGARFLGKAANKGLNAFEKLSKPGLKGASGSFGSFGSKKLVWGLFLGLFFFVFFSGIIGGITGTTPSGQAAPISPPSYAGGGADTISCPLNGGEIIAGSKDRGGHCSPDYQTDFPCLEPDVTGRATAVDIKSTDRFVYLPNINNKPAIWLIEDINTDTNYISAGQNVEGGFAVIARAQSEEGKEYRIRFVHIESTGLQKGESVPSGTAVGPYRTKEDHAHITIQEGLEFKPGDTYFNLCK